MAFSATVRGVIPLGGAGAIRLFYGEWTGKSGDTAGSLAIAGGQPLMAVFQKFDPIDKSYQIIPRIETSFSSGITTYTIENQDTVASGKFVVIHGGG